MNTEKRLLKLRFFLFPHMSRCAVLYVLISRISNELVRFYLLPPLFKLKEKKAVTVTKMTNIPENSKSD